MSNWDIISFYNVSWVIVGTIAMADTSAFSWLVLAVGIIGCNFIFLRDEWETAV